MAKFSEYAKIIEERIRRGDYALAGLPTETRLAEEMGASRLTARRTLQHLIAQGLLVRKPHGRVAINVRHRRLSGHLQLACLAPTFQSTDIERWRFSVERAASTSKATLRVVDYTHWDSPVMAQVLRRGFDGVFLVANSEEIPPRTAEQLQRAKHLVILGGDLSGLGVPSVQVLPPASVSRLGDHLVQLGHRSVDCLNTQPRDAQIVKRIEHWKFWQKMRGIPGRLIDDPVQPYEHPTPRAYAALARLLKSGEFAATGLICMTEEAAIGAMRALHEHGSVLGKYVSVCAFGNNGILARHLNPSLTILEPPDATPYLRVCLDWFAQKTASWAGPLLVEPSEVSLFAGESTGPGPAATVRGRHAKANASAPGKVLPSENGKSFVNVSA